MIVQVHLFVQQYRLAVVPVVFLRKNDCTAPAERTFFQRTDNQAEALLSFGRIVAEQLAHPQHRQQKESQCQQGPTRICPCNQAQGAECCRSGRCRCGDGCCWRKQLFRLCALCMQAHGWRCRGRGCQQCFDRCHGLLPQAGLRNAELHEWQQQATQRAAQQQQTVGAEQGVAAET